MSHSAEKILKRFSKAKKRKTNWSELYEDALTYIAPHKEVFHDDLCAGEDRSGRGIVFDSTGQDNAQKFASNIQSSLTPPFREWIQLKVGPQLEGDTQAKQALSDMTKILFTNLQNSNFDTQAAESYLDLCVGTAAMLVFKGDVNHPFNFVNVPLHQLYLEEGANGKIDTAFREWKIPVRNIKDTWPDAEIGDELESKLVQNPDEEIWLIEATVPTKIDVKNPEGDGMIEIDGYEYTVITKKGKTAIVTRKQRSNPWVIFRWSTIPGEIYGRGPAIFALPDIKTLNMTKRLLLENASISISGMYTVEDDGEMSTENLRFGPGAAIPVSSNGGSRAPSIMPLNPPGAPDLAQIIIQDLKRSIGNMMFADPLGPIDLPVKSATEVSLRQQELSKRIGAAFGKLQFEFITPLVNRCLDIMDELGIVDLGPLRVDGNNLAIKHVSPLALAQIEEEVVNVQRLATLVSQLYGPEFLAVTLPAEKLVPWMSNKLNIDQDLPATKEELAQAAQLIQQLIAQQGQGGGEPPQ